MVEASLAVMSTFLDKSAVECIELHQLLAEVRGQREKDHVGAQVVLGEAKARATKAEKALAKAKAKGAGIM